MSEPSRELTLRTIPRQQRSRERFELVLDTAEALLTEEGYAAFSTTAVAARAGLTSSTVYRWFDDKDDLAAALVMRHLEQLDEAVFEGLDALPAEASLADTVVLVFNVYVEYYRAHPSHVILWFEGRAGQAALAAIHDYTKRLSAAMYEHSVASGRLPATVSAADILLMSEMVDRILEYAFRSDPTGDADILARGLNLTQACYEHLLAQAPED